MKKKAYRLFFCFYQSRLILLVGLISLAAMPVWAHPHVFIDYSVQFLFNEEGLDGIRCRWKYDAITSSDLIANHDSDSDDKLSEAEAASLAEELTDHFVNYYYHTTMIQEGEYIFLENVESPRAWQEKNRVFFEFVIPADLETQDEYRQVLVVQSDTDYYMAFNLAEKNGGMDRLINADYFDVEIEQRDSMEAMAFAGSETPQDLILRFRQKTAAADVATSGTVAGTSGETGIAGLETEEGEFREKSAPQKKKSLGIRAWIFAQQRKLQEKMEVLLSSENDGTALKTILLLCLISFGYGVLHAAGPGHGKVITAAWLAGDGRRFASGLVLGSLLALFHGISGIAVVLIGRFILERTAMATMGSADKPLQIISFSLIALLGMFLILKELITWRKAGSACCRKKAGDAEKGEQELMIGHEAEDALEEAVERKDKLSHIVLLALAAGIVPCPGVVLVMLFCSAMGRTVLGLLLALCVTLGMAITISLTGLVVILARNAALRRTNIKDSSLRRVEKGFRLAGGTLIFVLGAFFLSIAMGG
ncbi:MAG: DUF1007 family protein [Candidatus Sumerlaeia bacterium]